MGVGRAQLLRLLELACAEHEVRVLLSKALHEAIEVRQCLPQRANLDMKTMAKLLKQNINITISRIQLGTKPHLNVFV